MASRSTANKVAPRGVFAFSLLLGAICGVALVRHGIVLPLVFFLPLAGSVTFFYGRRFGLLAAVALLTGIATAKLQLCLDRPLLPAYQPVVVRLADTNQTAVNGLPAPTFFAATLRQDGNEIPVAVQLPRGSRAPAYGAVLQGFAEITPPPNANDPFGSFCAARRYRGIVRFRTFRQIGEEKGFIGTLLRGRDFLLRRLIAPIDSDDARAIGAALLFGVRSGMRGELRQKFVDAGTVHLFSVSGMHVAVLAAILLAVLRFCPLKGRYLAAIALLGIYTLITGANPPAVRAFFLIGVWALGKAFLRETPAIEILGIIAAAMLFANPALLGDIGAQYSFFITALLLVSGEFRRREIVPAAELLMTGDEKKRYLKIRHWHTFFPEALFFCTVAFAGSIGITLLAGNDLRPGSIVANLLFTVGAVPLFAVGLTVLAIPGAGIVFGKLLLAATGWCEICGKTFPNVDYTAPYTWQVSLYALALLLGFFAAGTWIRRAAWTTVAALLCFWLMRGETTPDAVAFFQSDGKSCPALVVVESRFHRATCVNLPDFRAQDELEKFLRQHGVTSIESVYLTQNRRRNCGCIARLTGVYRPKRIIAAPGKIPATLNAFLESYAHRSDLETGRQNGFCRIFPDPAGFSLDYFFARDNVNAKLLLCDDDSGRKIRATIDGKAWFEVQKKWAKNPRIWSFDVPRP